MIEITVDYSLEKRLWDIKEYYNSGIPQRQAEINSLKIEHDEADKINDARTISIIGTSLNMRLTAALAKAQSDNDYDKAIEENWFDKSIN
jgi:hypothetical protein